MLSLLVIFIYTLILIVFLFKAIKLLFSLKSQLKSKVNSWFILFSGLLFLSLLSISSVFLVANSTIKNLPSRQQSVSDIKFVQSVNEDDCTKLLDFIYQSENAIYKLENHRYIEQTAPLFTVKIEYRKGAKRLQEIAAEYESLELKDQTKEYSQRIAEIMKEKASLFEIRSELLENSDRSKQEIAQLLRKMDLATTKRQETINVIKQQCT